MFSTFAAGQSPSGTVQQSQALLDQIIADSQKHAYLRTTQANHPLRVAEAIAAGAAGDLGEYNDLMIEVITRWARAGELSEAGYLAENLPAEGSARAHLEIAFAQFHNGHRDLAATHAAKALETIEQARGRKAELLRTRYAELLYVLNRADEAKVVESRLSDLAQLELEAKLQVLKVRPVLNLTQAKERMARCEDRGVDRVRTAFLLGCADQQLREGHQKEGLELLQEAGRLATRDGLPSAQRALVDLARIAHAGGEFKEADKAIKLYLEILKTYAEAADWKAPYLAEALDLLLDWKGREDLVREWLKVAEAGLAKLFILDVPKSTLALARIADRLEGAMEGDRLVMQAARAGRSHPHPRAQASAGVQICLHYADLGREIPVEILKVINPQMEAAAN